MQNFIAYLKETKAEMAHVSWPTRDQIVSYTTVVIALSLVTAALLGAFDALFTYLLETYILT
ncbi:preprotein translocase subunit SecE [bacterium]|nr:preprotein translocase subunit SecE [bacterium]